MSSQEHVGNKDHTRDASLSKRIQRTRSAVVDDVVNKYGDSVCFNLAPGAPFFGISDAARRKAAQLLEDSPSAETLSRYGDVLGTHSLRRMWANVLAKGYSEDGVAGGNLKDAEDIYPDHELMITAGANQAFVNIILALCNEGDDVLLLLPYYFSHHCALVMTGVNPVCVPVDERTFLPNVDEIEARITSRCKAIVVVSPGNPSGVTYPPDVMQAICKLCSANGIWLILDEAYREFVFSTSPQPAAAPCINQYTIHLFTMSKAYGLAGWRVGALLYPKRISEEVRKAQDTIPTHTSKFSEYVACEALQTNPLRDHRGEMDVISEVNQVRKVFIEALKSVYDGSCLSQRFVIPDGAFYFFLPYIDRKDEEEITEANDWSVVEYMAICHDTLVTPGFIFGLPGYVRVSYGGIRLSKAVECANVLARGLQQVKLRYVYN